MCGREFSGRIAPGICLQYLYHIEGALLCFIQSRLTGTSSDIAALSYASYELLSGLGQASKHFICCALLNGSAIEDARRKRARFRRKLVDNDLA